MRAERVWAWAAPQVCAFLPRANWGGRGCEVVRSKDFFSWSSVSSRYTQRVSRCVWNEYLTCFLVLLNNKEPVSKGHDQQPLNQVAKAPAEISGKAAPSKANDTAEGQVEVKKNKRERKEERQKNRKKEKKELKLENHQENSKSQKTKKRKMRQEAEQEAGAGDAAEAAGPAGKRGHRRKNKGQRAEEGAADGAADQAEAQARPGKRKRKLSEGVWLAHAGRLVRS